MSFVNEVWFMSSCVALIPARSGSKRVPDKNIKLLNGHPLLAYTVAAARESGVFEDVVVSTDSEHYAEIARHYGAEVPFLRSAAIAGDTSSDIEWVKAILWALAEQGRSYDGFSILRPTSPFRRAETITRAWEQFKTCSWGDSLRAVEKCGQHPGKMWVLRGGVMHPLLPLSPEEMPWHSKQYAALPTVYVQNASLEIAWTRVVWETGTIAGNIVIPFLTEGLEGFDINQPEDWVLADHYLQAHAGHLPDVGRPPWIEKISRG
jgi:CMP-N,N'-diacetyllegionaminic acid synthase